MATSWVGVWIAGVLSCVNEVVPVCRSVWRRSKSRGGIAGGVIAVGRGVIWRRLRGWRMSGVGSGKGLGVPADVEGCVVVSWWRAAGV